MWLVNTYISDLLVYMEINQNAERKECETAIVLILLQKFKVYELNGVSLLIILIHKMVETVLVSFFSTFNSNL